MVDYKKSDEGGVVSPKGQKHSGHCHFLSHIRKKSTKEPIRWKSQAVFSPLVLHARLGPLNLKSWRLPVCRIQPRWSIQSEGPRDTLPRGCVCVWVCVRPCVCVCWGVNGREEALWAPENAWWWVTKNRAPGGQWDRGHSWHNPNTPGRKWGGLLVSMAPRPKRRNGCLFCPLWCWRWTESRRLETHTHIITPLKGEPPIRDWTCTAAED